MKFLACFLVFSMMMSFWIFHLSDGTRRMPRYV